MAKDNLVVGCDIGGSKINFVVWDGRKVVKCLLVEKPTIAKLKEGIERFADIKKIGFGVPGIFDAKTKKIIECPNLSEFNGLNVKKLFPGRQIKMDNDAHCFLLAEKMLGGAKNQKNVVAVTMGTGIGGAFTNEKINNEIIYKGKNGWAGELGRIIIDKGQSWEKLYQKTKNKPKEQEKINSVGLANLINIFNPELIILGGAGAKLPKKELIAQYLFDVKQMPKIIAGTFGKDAAAIGATMLFNSQNY